MFSSRLLVPLVNRLTPPPKIKPSLSSSSSSSSHHLPRSRSRSRSQTRRLIVPKRSSPTAPPSATVRGAVESSEPDPEPLPADLVAERMPKHMAVILDGHGRWAKLRGLPPSAGHEVGMQSLRRLVRLSYSWGIEVLSMFVFSTENWFRPKEEVDYYMKLVERTINSSIGWMEKQGIRINVIGDSSKLPESLQRTIATAEENTKHNSRLQLILAISYSGKYDVVQACKRVAKKVKYGHLHLDDINENIVEQELETNCTEFPYPDLLIRPGGDLRVSNFFLWQLAYTELYFNPKLWPDFGEDDFVDALRSFQQRQRRHGRRLS